MNAPSCSHNTKFRQVSSQIIFPGIENCLTCVSCSLKSQSAQGHKAVQAEMEERTKVCEELQGIREWLAAAGTVLSELEQAPNTERLQVGLSPSKTILDKKAVSNSLSKCTPLNVRNKLFSDHYNALRKSATLYTT